MCWSIKRDPPWVSARTKLTLLLWLAKIRHCGTLQHRNEIKYLEKGSRLEQVRIQFLTNAVKRDLPHSNNAAMRLFAALGEDRSWILEPQKRIAVPTGVSIQLPDGVEGSITPLESICLNMLNRPGTIDPDYRGEVFVIFLNDTEEAIEIKCGEHIADLRLRPFIQASFVEVN